MLDATSTARIAAAGDLHCHDANRERVRRAFAELEGRADLVLLAGDLTTHGEPEQAAVLADACREVSAPVFAVLGNHDWHADRTAEVVAVLQEAGVTVLDRAAAVCTVAGVQVGIVGTKGFVGGFAGSHLPDFGEPLLRRLYAETTQEVKALARGLKEVAHCPIRIVLLHYSPALETLAGEAPGIISMLGSDRLAGPIAEHEPDLVLHGHAHAGSFEARIGTAPVYNVSVPVMRRDFWVFEMSGLERATTPVH
jgi:Icc-related predicted phosphoesterase